MPTNIATSTIKSQRTNANKHTARGMAQLERSIQADGWIGALTVAADGETFDGSARVDVIGSAGFDEALIVESDGSRPVIVKRTDIPSADDPRAVRLGLAANRVAQLNLDYDLDVLAGLAADVDLAGLWTDDEMTELLSSAGDIVLGGQPIDSDATCTCPNCGQVFTP